MINVFNLLFLLVLEVDKPHSIANRTAVRQKTESFFNIEFKTMERPYRKHYQGYINHFVLF
jgi:hypothetical protein